jgi:hypothetical protein
MLGRHRNEISLGRRDDASYCLTIHHLNLQLDLVQPMDECRQSGACDLGQLFVLQDERPDPLAPVHYLHHHLVTLCDFSHRENHGGVSSDLIGPRLACFADLCDRLSIYRQNRSCP